MNMSAIFHYKRFLLVLALVLGLSGPGTTTLWAQETEPCPAGTCRFLGLDDEIAVSMHNNSSNESDNRLRTYVGYDQEAVITLDDDHRTWNRNTSRAAEHNLVSSVTVAGKMTVDPLTEVRDEVFTVSIVEYDAAEVAKVIVNRMGTDNDYAASDDNAELILEMTINDDDDNSESRIGAAMGNLTGDLRDELVFAYENTSGYLELCMLKNEDMGTDIAERSPACTPGSTKLKQGHGIVLATGNFDGDAYDEIAVLYEVGAGVQLEIYSVNEANMISFVVSQTINHKKEDSGGDSCRNIAIAAGDFNDNGIDEILTATIAGIGKLYISYYEFEKGSLTLRTREKIFEASSSNNTDARWLSPDLRMLSADLDLNGTDEGLISYQKDLSTSPIDLGARYFIDKITISEQGEGGTPEILSSHERTINALYGIRAMDIAVVTDVVTDAETATQLPESQIVSAILYSHSYTSSGGDYRLEVSNASDLLYNTDIHYNRHLFWPVHVDTGDQIRPSWTFSAVAGEFDGEGVELEDAEEFTIHELYQPVLVLQTPPQHIDVFENGVSNVSYRTEFYSQFNYEENSNEQAKNSSKAEYGNGFYALGHLGGGTKTTAGGIEGKMDVMWKNAVASSHETYQKTNFTSDLKTSSDDLVRYNTQEVVYWRYPSFTNANEEEFVQFSVPQSRTSHDANGSGLKYYQPGHENGNLLSYPWFYEAQEGVEELNSGTVFEIGTGGFHQAIALIEGQTNEVTQTTGHTLKGSLGVYFKTSPGDQPGVDAEIHAGYQHDQLVEETSTSKTETSGMEKISIDKTVGKVEVPTEQSYKIQPHFFRNEEGGPIQISYTVDPDLGEWWQSTYNNIYPDLALNLPDRWQRTGGLGSAAYDYVPNEDVSRLRMKGFFVYSEVAGAEEMRQVWGGKVNEAVTLKARVYNYSLVEAEDVNVRFQYQVWNGSSWTQRINIGDVNVGTIPAWGNSSNQINRAWAETSFTPTQTGYYCF